MSDWGDKTVEGGEYHPSKQKNRDPAQWNPCGSFKDGAGKAIAYDRFNKCFRPVKDGQWAGSPDDVTPIGNKPTDSELANAYIIQLKTDGNLLKLIEVTGFHHPFIANLRVQLTRISQRLNMIGRDRLGKAEYNRRKNLEDGEEGKIYSLTGLRIPSEWTIKAVKNPKEADSAFNEALAFLGVK